MLVGPLRKVLNELEIGTTDADGKSFSRVKVREFTCIIHNHIIPTLHFFYTYHFQLREILKDHVQSQDTSSDSEADPYLKRTIWWCLNGDYYRGVIVSKNLDEGGNVLYHVKYSDGDEADLDMDDIDSDEYTFTLPEEDTSIIHSDSDSEENEQTIL